MILERIQAKSKGQYISCYIGNKKYTSWWTSPPDPVDHVGIEYLNDRYSCITTEKRVKKFKQLYKELMKSEVEL